MNFISAMLTGLIHFSHWLLQRSSVSTVVVLLKEGDQVLLVRSAYRAGWNLPGGFLNPPESYEAGARREVLEELGYEVLDLHLVHITHSRVFPGITNYCAVFRATSFNAIRSRAPNWEIQETRWFHASQLPAGTTSFIRSCVSAATAIPTADTP